MILTFKGKKEGESTITLNVVDACDVMGNKVSINPSTSAKVYIAGQKEITQQKPEVCRVAEDIKSEKIREFVYKSSHIFLKIKFDSSDRSASLLSYYNLCFFYWLIYKF